MKDINKRLELLRRINCLGIQDIEKAFKDDSNLNHLLNKYTACREDKGSYGNFKFIFDLDCDYASQLFKSIGYHGVKLGDKFVPEEYLLSETELDLLSEVTRTYVELGEENAENGEQLDGIINKINEL